MRATLKISIQWISQTPLWFRGAIVIGLALRLYFCLFTEGTYDVAIWRGHAERIGELGLIGYYHETPLANHPPFISETASGMLIVSQRTGIPFRVLLRMPFVLIDAGTFIVLLLVLARQPRRLLLASAYWLHPLAVLFSSYHGNTDSSVAFFVLLAAWLLSRVAVRASAGRGPAIDPAGRRNRSGPE